MYERGLDHELHGDLCLRPFMSHHMIDNRLQLTAAQFRLSTALALAKRDLVLKVMPAVLAFLIEAFPRVIAVGEGRHLHFLGHVSSYLLL